MNATLARLPHSALAVLAAAALHGSAPSAVAQGGPTAQVFATTGPGVLTDVPGEPSGTTFLSFGAPSIYDPFGLGDLAMIQPPAGAAPLAAIVRLQPAIIRGAAVAPLFTKGGALLVRAGDAAPGVTGAVFTKFGQPVFGGGHSGGAGYGFLATIADAPTRKLAATQITNAVAKGTETGLWSDCTGSLALVARTGDPVPDATGTAMPGVTFTQFITYVLPTLDAYSQGLFKRDSGLVFVAKIKGNGITGKNNLGVWFQDGTKAPGSDVSLLYRTGDMITLPDTGDTLPIKGLQVFLPSKDMPGQRRSYGPSGNIMALATFEKNRVCVINARPSNEPLFVLNPYGVLENTNVGHPMMPTTFQGRSYVMRAKLFRSAPFTQGRPGKVNASNDTVILRGDGQSFFFDQYETGDDSFFVQGAVFTDFGEPASNDSGTGLPLFTAKIKGTGVDKTNDTLLIQPNRGLGGLIARTGNHALGTPEGVLFKSFVSYAMPEANGQSNNGDVNLLYFLARLTGTGVTAMNDTGLWAHDFSNNLVLLARTGDPITVGPGDTRTILMISTLNAVADSAGQGRFVDVLGNICALITFTDHTTALVRFNVGGGIAPG